HAGHPLSGSAFANSYGWNESGGTPPAPPPSAEGMALPAGGAGTLTTSDGVWSFGAAAAGGFSILRNGQSAAGGSASSLEVAQNGHVFADTAAGNWSEWNGSGSGRAAGRESV